MKSILSNDVTRFLTTLKTVFPPQVDVSFVGKNGKCYQVALLLRQVWPSAQIYYSRVEGHVYTLIDGLFYDIDGICLDPPVDIELLDHRCGHRPHRWHKTFNTVPVDYWLRTDDGR